MKMFKDYNLNLILTIVIVSIIFLCLLIVNTRLILVKRIKTKVKPLVKSELVKKKFFRTSDNYQLKWLGEIKKESSHIILGVHDFGMSRKSFIDTEMYINKYYKNISFLSYDQRNFGENENCNKFNYGYLINDLREIIIYLENKYPDKKLILLGEGFGSSLSSYFVNHSYVNKVILSSIYVKQFNKISFSIIIKFLFSFLFTYNIKINNKLYGEDCTNNSQYAKKLGELLQRKKSIKEFMQISKINKKLASNINKKEKSVVFLLPLNDVFISKKWLLTNLRDISNKKFQIIKFEKNKHFLLNDLNNKEIVETILKDI
ncbi:hypothetical protein SCORR_v1c01990 [Spiroplasma corruscae]|uniref:Serine aminopeptidase S33 domain-containing protein n=1 Tax=Spiroplasma corruscae TaxID=216934 RepID=A0A222ENW1_9MOLU|nr:alpha/beta hydrolase [Spiroplasma corruscae]ASP27974.1 hypothetical protein SCORR_v1c01990 [Spiroplasma corruscae]